MFKRFSFNVCDQKLLLLAFYVKPYLNVLVFLPKVLWQMFHQAIDFHHLYILSNNKIYFIKPNSFLSLTRRFFDFAKKKMLVAMIFYIVRIYQIQQNHTELVVITFRKIKFSHFDILYCIAKSQQHGLFVKLKESIIYLVITNSNFQSKLQIRTSRKSVFIKLKIELYFVK